MADTTTIVSMTPYSFNSVLPQTSPSLVIIPASEVGDFSIVHIERAFSLVYIDHDRGYMQRPILSEDLARSIINDHISALINVIPGAAQPGIFFVNGEHSKEDIKKKFPHLLKIAADQQRAWFVELVKQADHDWSRTHSPRSVSSLQRNAAKFLNLPREWDVDTEISNIILCPMCKNDTRGAIVCPNCKFIMDEAAYAKVKDKFAKV